MAHPPYHYPDIGIAGEDLVAQWLQSKGWVILHRRWRYRQGEIDIIAEYDGQQETSTQKDLGKLPHLPSWHLSKSKLVAKAIGMQGEETPSQNRSKQNSGIQP
jgi:hypothetical protein